MKIVHLMVFVVFLCIPLTSRAAEQWRITDFNSDIALTSEGVVDVTEQIAVDFGGEQKHGIYRDLPLTYELDTGETVYSRLTVGAVQQDGLAAQVDVTRSSSSVRIRIGDPDHTISGAHVYVIQYQVIGVLRAFSGFDELNWDVTGTEWAVPIDRATARISIPAAITQAACYQGVLGATASCGALEQEAMQVTAHADGLSSYEGLTVAVGYTPGAIPIVTVSGPPLLEVFSNLTTWALAMAVFLIGASLLLRQWWRFGRDRRQLSKVLPGITTPRVKDTGDERPVPLFFRAPIPVEYEPPNGLRPAEIGVLIDERADTVDIAATVVDLAARGYLEITELDTAFFFSSRDYELTRTGRVFSGAAYEQELINRLFNNKKTVRVSALRNSFYRDLAAIQKKLYREVVTKGLFPRQPQNVRGKFHAAAVGSSAATLIAGGLFISHLLGAAAVMPWYPVVAGVLVGGLGVGIVAVVTAQFMPRKTAYGRALYERSLGYRNFINATEKYRAKWLEDEGLFEQVLPYAVMFGLAEKLARSLEQLGIKTKEPAWYHGAGPFNAAVFTRDVQAMATTFRSTALSSPSSSGGGSSGGGFGGGGGGSW